MRTATKEFKWDMAHRLPTHKGKCWNVHGHTYKALITIEGDLQEEGAEKGMIKDFGNFDLVKKWIDDNRDHAYLGDIKDKVYEFLQKEGFKAFGIIGSPTAENIAMILYEISAKLLECKIKSVTVYETPTSFSKYGE